MQMIIRVLYTNHGMIRCINQLVRLVRLDDGDFYPLGLLFSSCYFGPAFASPHKIHSSGLAAACECVRQISIVILATLR